jgi:hypothetical protein
MVGDATGHQRQIELSVSRSTCGKVTPKDGDGLGSWTLLVDAGRPERSAIGTEQEQGIRSRLPALVKQQQADQVSGAALRLGRPSGRTAAVGS